MTGSVIIPRKCPRCKAGDLTLGSFRAVSGIHGDVEECTNCGYRADVRVTNEKGWPIRRKGSIRDKFKKK